MVRFFIMLTLITSLLVPVAIAESSSITQLNQQALDSVFEKNSDSLPALLSQDEMTNTKGEWWVGPAIGAGISLAAYATSCTITNTCSAEGAGMAVVGGVVMFYGTPVIAGALGLNLSSSLAMSYSYSIAYNLSKHNISVGYGP